VKVAIHQPNFLPWLGIFHRAAMVDRFVFFDHVQALRGKSWLTRNRILVQGQARWLTLPTRKAGAGLQAVNEVRIQWDNPAVAKHLRILEAEYGRHPHFAEVYGLVAELYDERPPLIADLNKAFFSRVLERLRIGAELMSSTELAVRDPRLLELHGNDLVVETCLAANATEYVSGDGCFDFVEPAAFEAAGVEFWVQRFVHPEYTQLGSAAFVSHLSVIDALCNVGFDGVGALVRPEARERLAA
jgi:hypothetical protein